MSQLTHTQPPILGFRLGLRLWLLAAAVIACAAVSLLLVISHDDKAAVMPKPAVSDTPAGMRYDGGPDEGTRGLMRSGPARSSATTAARRRAATASGTRAPSRSLRPAPATTAAPRRAHAACRPPALQRPLPQAFASMVAPRKVRAGWGSSASTKQARELPALVQVNKARGRHESPPRLFKSASPREPLPHRPEMRAQRGASTPPQDEHRSSGLA